MATINKSFKIKNGLIVEGSTATVNGNNILTETASDQYIIDLIGGETLVTSVSGNLTVTNGDLTINETGLATNLSGDYLTDSAGVLNVDIEGIADDLIANADFATTTDISTALNDYTPTNSLDTTVGGYGYLKSGDLPTMYSDADVDAHLSGGDGITYSSGTISADVAGGLEITGGQIVIDRDTTDSWYDANGAAGDVAQDLSDHESDTSTHGVTEIVGTSETQVLTNKTINDELGFTNPSTQSVDGGIKVNDSNENFEIRAYTADIEIISDSGDITLSPNGTAYYGGTTAADEIATHGYVDNAVAGLTWKQSVNLLYNDATPTLSGDSVTTPLVIDGHPALGAGEVGYRILVAYGDDAGLYVYNQTGTSWTLDRAADGDTYEELVGAAVYVMEGTTYGSTSWVQGNHYLSAFTGQSWTQFSGQGSVTAGSGITVDGLEVSIDRDTVDTWYDAAGAAGGVQDNLDDHTGASSNVHGVTGSVVGTTDSQTLTNKTIDAGDNTLSNIPNSSLTNSSVTVNNNSVSLGDSITLDTDDISEGATNEYFTQARARGSVSAGTGINYDSNTGVIDADLADFDTDDLSEGTTNKYFTDERAQDAVADAIAAGTHSNITITYDDTLNKFTFEAENGVANSTTADLDEDPSATLTSGTMYLTQQRVLDSINTEAITPLSVDINVYRKEEATQQYVVSASTVTAHTFTGNRSVKYLVRTVGEVSGTLHSQITELLATVDANNNVAVTEYGTICTSESSLSTATVDYSGGEYRLRVTTAVAGAEVIAAATIMSWAD